MPSRKLISAFALGLPALAICLALGIVLTSRDLYQLPEGGADDVTVHAAISIQNLEEQGIWQIGRAHV